MIDICIVCNSKDAEDIRMNDLPAFRCRYCGLRWLREMPCEDYYKKTYPIELTKDKLSGRVINVRDRIRTFRQYAPLLKVCDIGCGEGVFLNELDKASYRCGIEPNPENVAHAQSLGLKVLLGNVEDVPALFDAACIETYAMFHVIEHLTNPRASLNLLYDFMQPGSYLVLETPDSNSHVLRANDYKHSLVNPEHLFYFNQSNLSILLESIGFKTVAVGKRSYVGAHLGFKERVRLWIKGALGHFEHQWLVVKKLN
jgi:2-polyprenyl-3-methyl-5-hydroxy-6-metoxy-1,4-benzoquinol methylase